MCRKHFARRQRSHEGIPTRMAAFVHPGMPHAYKGILEDDGPEGVRSQKMIKTHSIANPA